jgi:hypothetical protein
LVVNNSSDVIRAAHMNNLYQNLVNFAGSGHTHTISDGNTPGTDYYPTPRYWWGYWWWGWYWWGWYWWWWY